jgi:gluconokinase
VRSTKRQYVVSVDIGTTRCKAMLYRIGGAVVQTTDREYRTHHPRPGYVEQDPEEVLKAAVRTVADLVEKTGIPPGSVATLSFAGIWQSILPVDRQGRALAPSLTWADCRALRQSERLRRELSAEEVLERTGCTIHPMYFLPRLLWYRENAPELFEKTDRFVSIKEYVLHKLFGTFKADRSIASGTGIWSMRTMDWDEQLLQAVGCSPRMFPPVFEPTESAGGLVPGYAAAMGLRSGTPGILGAADGALSHLGSCGLRADRMSITVGTGSGLRRRKEEPTVLKGSELWCYYMVDGSWLLGGIVQAAGNVVKWFADNFLAEETSESQALEKLNRFAEAIAPGSEGLLFLPLLAGERSPHYRPEARGLVYGLTFSHTKRHLIRAVLEGISYRLYSVYALLASGENPEIVVTGGILNSPVWLQITADFFGERLRVPNILETSAWGGILLGLQSLGILSGPEQVDKMIELSRDIVPAPEAHRRYKEVHMAQQELYRRMFEVPERKMPFPG